jgi:shikimate kinase
MSVEKKCSMKVVDIFQNKGEDFFRTQEEMAVLDSLKEKNCVIALGGGAFLNKKLRDKVLKYSISIWLDVNLKTLNSRIKWNKKRPLLNVKNSIKKIQKLYLERKNIYKLSHYKLNCDNLTKENITKKIINFYETQ